MQTIDQKWKDCKYKLRIDQGLSLIEFHFGRYVRVTGSYQSS